MLFCSRLGCTALCPWVLSVGLMVGSLCSPESSELQSDEPVSFFRGLKLVMNHGAYIKLITGFLFTSLAFMVRRAGLEDGAGGKLEPRGPGSVIWSRAVMWVESGHWHLFGVARVSSSDPSAPFAAAGGQLCPILHLHLGLPQRVPEHPLGHHGAYGPTGPPRAGMHTMASHVQAGE